MAVRSPFLSLVLVLSLIVTAQAAAVARGAPAPVGEAVICTGGGLVVIALDADGNPAGPAHVCPDATATLTVVAPDAPATAPRLAMTPLALALSPLPVPLVNQSRPGSARDPPHLL